MSDVQLRHQFTDTISHVRQVVTTVRGNSGPHGIFRPPDTHKIVEGLFLSGWTHWEQFLHYLLVCDVAFVQSSILRRSVTRFRTRGAPRRIADQMLTHPDHPKAFVDWSEYETIRQRADEYVGRNHRFDRLNNDRRTRLAFLKRIRNAIAHRSDRAWESFTNMCRTPPFNLTRRQMRGITPGRFLIAHNWNGQIIILESMTILEDSARAIVP